VTYEVLEAAAYVFAGIKETTISVNASKNAAARLVILPIFCSSSFLMIICKFIYQCTGKADINAIDNKYQCCNQRVYSEATKPLTEQTAEDFDHTMNVDGGGLTCHILPKFEFYQL
jgi:hypothetical protein